MPVAMLSREEYIEQEYLFRTLLERLPQNLPLQEVLRQVKEELLATTNLPLAVDFLRSELEHCGELAPGMGRLGHYFTPFQTYLVAEAEREAGRFDMRTALAILRAEAVYRAADWTPAGLFVFQFEALCRNRLRYDHGLKAMSDDPAFAGDWRAWILLVRKQIGLVEFADLLYARSQRRQHLAGLESNEPSPPEMPMLFGDKEGKIALASRGKDPLYLFAALQRHLGYPLVPRPEPRDAAQELLPQVLRRMERLEMRMKLLEDENRQGIDITKYYGGDDLGAMRPPSPE